LFTETPYTGVSLKTIYLWLFRVILHAKHKAAMTYSTFSLAIIQALEVLLYSQNNNGSV
jgi:hypothetical protein